MLGRLGLLREIDRSALALYCQAWADSIMTRRVLKQSGTTIKGLDGGFMRNSFLKVATTAAKQMHEFLVEFGMSLSARTRVAAIPRTDTRVLNRTG